MIDFEVDCTKKYRRTVCKVYLHGSAFGKADLAKHAEKILNVSSRFLGENNTYKLDSVDWVFVK